MALAGSVGVAYVVAVAVAATVVEAVFVASGDKHMLLVLILVPEYGMCYQL